MLGTLMKYEFKAVGRILLPLYAAWIITASMLGLSLGGNGENSTFVFITLSAILYAVATVSAVIFTLVILIQRFYKNLLGNEGYLMFALPVSTGKHLANKVISGAAWTLIGSLVAIMSGLAIVLTLEGFDSFWENLVFIVGDIKIAIEREPSSLLMLAEFILICIAGATAAVTKIYAAISVGHQWSNHRFLGAFAAYIGFGIIESLLGKLVNTVITTDVFDGICSKFSVLAQMHLSLVCVFILVSALAAAYWFISWYLLDKKLNLE